jgi:hypothetical protein
MSCKIFNIDVNFREAVSMTKSTNPQKNHPAPEGHTVQFYKFQEELYPSLRKYVRDGLAQGDGIIVIADRATRASIQGLGESDLQYIRAARGDRLIMFDSESMLAMFMRDDRPDPVLFQRAMSQLLLNMAKFPTLRAYGDMVNILCKKENFQAAVELENLWNELIHRHGFLLFCGYANGHFKHGKNHEHLQKICSTHAHALSLV